MHDPFPGSVDEWGDYIYKTSFDLMYLDNKPVYTYDRPVYTQEATKSIIYYDGGRYVMGNMDDFVTWNETGSFAKYISEDFNEHLHINDLLYVSDPTSLGSPMETTFRAWFTNGAGKSKCLTHNMVIFIKSNMVCRWLHYNR